VLAARTTVLGHSKGAYASTRIRRYGHTPAEPTKRLPRVQFLFSLMSRISGRFGHSVGPPVGLVSRSPANRADQANYCRPPFCRCCGDEAASGGGPIVLNLAF
jgi:hypothetical protein